MRTFVAIHGDSEPITVSAGVRDDDLIGIELGEDGQVEIVLDNLHLFGDLVERLMMEWERLCSRQYIGQSCRLWVGPTSGKPSVEGEIKGARYNRWTGRWSFTVVAEGKTHQNVGDDRVSFEDDPLAGEFYVQV